MAKTFQTVVRFLGIQDRVNTAEQFVSSIGGFISILLVFYVSYWMTDLHGAASILPSMGAATVLLFGLPNGPLSQPWALFAGNTIAAIIGVACYQLIDNPFVAASAAVGIAMTAMFSFRCVHPPGGATALAAVIGGDAIHNLGFYYVLVPTLVNCGIIFSVALLFNNLFGWRRYPAMRPISRLNPQGHAKRINTHYIQQALTENPLEIGETNASNLKNLFEQAMAYQDADPKQALTLTIGAYYSNENTGFNWAVREICDLSPHQNPQHDLVIYRTIKGKHKHRSDSCTVEEFRQWATAEVFF